MFRGNNAAYSGSSIDDGSRFACTKPCYVYGNIMSLIITPTGFEKATTLTAPYTFQRLFYNEKNIHSHPTQKLLLPATTLTDCCYYAMFGNCSGLTRAPELPATTLAEKCYSNMFNACCALVEAPDLPATKKCFTSVQSSTASPALLPTSRRLIVRSCGSQALPPAVRSPSQARPHHGRGVSAASPKGGR